MCVCACACVRVHVGGRERADQLLYGFGFQCVILTECPMSVQVRVNNYCRTCSPPVKVSRVCVVVPQSP